MKVSSEECIWPKVGYETFTLETEVPDISESQIDCYFIKYGRKQGVQRTKSLDKGKKMCESLCAEACSVLSTDGMCFFTGLIQASMKKHVRYWTKLSCTLQGEIMNSECECPGGAGPHATCKHLACMGYVVTGRIMRNQILVKKACTEQLQTFHHPARKLKGLINFSSCVQTFKFLIVYCLPLMSALPT